MKKTMLAACAVAVLLNAAAQDVLERENREHIWETSPHIGAPLPPNVVSAAYSVVPADAAYINYKVVKGRYEIYFSCQNTEMYSVEFAPFMDKVTSVEVISFSNPVGQEVIVSERNARDIVKNRFPTAQSILVRLVPEEAGSKYEVSFTTNKFSGILYINPSTGKVCDQKHTYF